MPIRKLGAALLGALLLVVGCSGKVEPDRSGAVPATVDDGDQWDRLRDDALAEYGEELLAAGRMDSLPRDVEFIRYVEPGEWAQVHAECVQSMGFEAQATRDGAVEYGHVPPDQQLAMDEALYRCEAMYPMHPRFSLPFDDQQLTALYDYQVNDLTECLRAEGYEVPEPPSLETFIAQHHNPDDAVHGPWSPYRDVVFTAQGEDWYHINATCPQTPPLERLYDVDLP